jgi:hypothetical protein
VRLALLHLLIEPPFFDSLLNSSYLNRAPFECTAPAKTMVEAEHLANLPAP